MRVLEPEEERPLAWNAILENTVVRSADADEVGAVDEVLGAEDIFHGIILRSGDSGDMKLILADQVGLITNRKIDVRLTSEQVRELPAYEPEDSYRLGLVGLFRKHLGWVEGSDERG